MNDPMPNLDTWMDTYTTKLAEVAEKYPGEYPWWPNVPVALVAERMRNGFQKGTYNKDGRAIKATCKALGITYTYTAINAYLRGGRE